MTASAPLPEPDEPQELNPHALTAEGQGSNIPLAWKPTAKEPVPVVRCAQIKKDGLRCKNWSLRGYIKCRKHAGPGVMKDGNVAKYAEAVIEAGRLRLVDSSDMAIDVLNELLGPGSSEGIRLKAATEVLDRTGIRGGFDIKVEGEVTVSASDEIQARLDKLAKGAAHVKEMRERAQRERDEELEQIIDAEVVSDKPDDEDGQAVLF